MCPTSHTLLCIHSMMADFFSQACKVNPLAAFAWPGRCATSHHTVSSLPPFSLNPKALANSFFFFLLNLSPTHSFPPSQSLFTDTLPSCLTKLNTARNQSTKPWRTTPTASKQYALSTRTTSTPLLPLRQEPLSTSRLTRTRRPKSHSSSGVISNKHLRMSFISDTRLESSPSSKESTLGRTLLVILLGLERSRHTQGYSINRVVLKADPSFFMKIDWFLIELPHSLMQS